MDPRCRVQRALAIAGDRIAGGVGTHETALASPESSTSAAAASCPGFTDSHVHFPTWALAQRQIRLDGARSLDEALERVATRPGSRRALAARPRLARRRLAPTGDADEGGARRGHGRPARRAARARLPLALAQLRRARARGRRPRRRRRRRRTRRARRADRRASRGSLPGGSRTAISPCRTPSTSTRCARASPSPRRAASRAVHDKDGWLGAVRLWQRLHEHGAHSRCASGSRLPHEHLDRARRGRRSRRASATHICASAT